MEDLLKGLLFVIAICVAPLVVLGWLVYRLIRGGKDKDFSIKQPRIISRPAVFCIDFAAGFA
jgi:hypothetical protein